MRQRFITKCVKCFMTEPDSFFTQCFYTRFITQRPRQAFIEFYVSWFSTFTGDVLIDGCSELSSSSVLLESKSGFLECDK